MPLLERETELAALDTAFEGAARGAGSLVLVTGQAGEGKSALVAAGRDRAASRGFHVRSARGDHELASGVLGQLFAPALAGTDDLPAIRAQLAAGGPVLLVVDDAHLADAASLRALALLAGQLDELPVAILAAVSPAEPGTPSDVLDDLRAAPAAVHLTVRPLGPDAVATAVRDRLSGAGRTLCVAAYEVTRGNPLYLHELLLTTAPDGQAPDPADLRRAAVSSLGERTARRVARIGPEAGDLVDALAILGEGAELAVAAALAGVDDTAAVQIAGALRAIELLAPGDPPAFAHPLIRRSTYDRIAAEDREALHRRAAAVLRERGAPMEIVADQLAATAPRGEDAVAATLLEAGRRALARGSPDEAVRWFGRGLAEGAAVPDPATVAAELAMGEMERRSPAAFDRLHEAHARSGDPATRYRLALAIADTSTLLGRWDHAMEAVTTARAELDPDDEDAEAELTAIGLMVSGYARGGRFPVDQARLEALVARPGWGARALAAVLATHAAHSGDTPRARALLDRALDGGVLLSERLASPWAAAQVVHAMAALDQYERGLAFCREVAAAAVRQGSLPARAMSADHGAWLQSRAGDLAVAEAEIRPGLKSGLAMGARTVTVAQLFYVQDAVLERPGLADAADLALGLDGVGLTGSSPDAMLHCVRGRIRLARREREAAVADLRHAVEVADTLSFGPTVAPLRSLLALALPQSAREEARALVEAELRAARATGLPRPEGVALGAAGIVAGGEEGITLLEAATETLGRSPARLEHARALIALGAALRRAHRRADARPPLTDGLELAEACGARHAAEGAREELRAAGGSPRPLHGPERDSLTASELRVARRAADGASNLDIAQELYVSLKTVETHLTSVYAKLGISGRGARSELARALG